MFYYEYYKLLFFLSLLLLIAFFLFLFVFLIGLRDYDLEKRSVYECGFDPFSDTRRTFEVRFYLVAILFIIFDLEITFLFPWSVVYLELSILGYLSVFLFLFVLLLGFIYEWLSGALEWE